MGSVGADEAAAAPGLRTAVDFYTAKAERLQQRQAELEAELAAVQTQLAKATSARDQLAEVLAEIADNNTISGPVHEPASTSPVRPGPEIDQDGPGQRSSQPVRVAAEAVHRTPSAPQSAQASAVTKSGEVMQAILQILVTAGRPMRVRDITEALGRPASGKEGRVPVETTRSTCKRLVKNGRAVEGPVGVFAIARSEVPPVKGAA